MTISDSQHPASSPAEKPEAFTLDSATEAVRTEYRARFLNHQQALARLTRLDRRFSLARAGVFVLALIFLIAAFNGVLFSIALTVIAAAAFIALIVFHERLHRDLRRHRATADFYEAGIARIEGRWGGLGPDGAEFLEPAHLNAADLDLFGRGSLFQLLCFARTAAGRARLASWLAAPASVSTVAARQAAARELAAALDLREDFALLGAELAAGVRPDALTDWANRPIRLASPGRRILAAALSLAALIGALLWLVPGIGSLPFALALLGESIWFFAHRHEIRRIVAEAHRPGRELTLLAAALDRLECEQFTSPALRDLAAHLSQDGLPPSTQVRRLQRRLDWLLNFELNQVARLFSLLFLGSSQLAMSLESWRARVGPAIPRWIDAVAEFEALLSLSGFAHEHPAYVFPELVESDAAAKPRIPNPNETPDAGQANGAAPDATEDDFPRRVPVLDATALGHPLLPPGRCVTNDLALGPDLRLLLVSGSNMSGKSTLMRSIGINAVLALAGAPVFAARLRLTPLVVGASIQLHDSLHEGASRFYAEIQRVRAIVERAASAGQPAPASSIPSNATSAAGAGEHDRTDSASETAPAHFAAPPPDDSALPCPPDNSASPQPPVLFLLDELFSGTNSDDRRVGAEAVVRRLVDLGAVGLVSTHDLALARIAEDLAPRAANVHFEDQFEDGVMRFDYRLRPGVVTRGNALELMRSIGLDV